MRNIFNYIDRPSPIHDLTGATKLVCLLLWSFAAMLTFDTRFVIALAVLSFVLLRLSMIRLSDVSFLLKLTIFFMLFNNLVLFLFSPQYGVEIYGTKHVLFGSGRFTLTQEQLSYHLNQMLKCFLPPPSTGSVSNTPSPIPWPWRCAISPISSASIMKSPRPSRRGALK